MHRRHPVLVGLAVALTASLAACTSPSNHERQSGSAGGQDADPAPQVSVSTVDDTAANSGDDAGTDSGDEDGTRGETASAQPDSASTDSGDAANVELKPSGHFALTVTGGKFTAVTVTDTEHPDISVDGTFEDGDGSSASSSSSATNGPTGASTSGPSSTSNDARAGGTTRPDADSSDDASRGATSGADASQGTASGTDPSPGATSGTDPSPGATSGADAAQTDPKGTRWISSYGLAGNSTYEWKATTVAPDGGVHEATGTVKTTEPKGRKAKVFTVIADGQDVGVAAPIILTLGATVPKAYRDDIEHRLHVTVTDDKGQPREVEGAWGWLPDADGLSRVHYRPKEFWPEHSKVKVTMALKDVPFSKQRFGEKDVSLDFGITREQTVKANAKTHRMVVTRGGKTVMDFPASLGAARSPSFNGTHVVMSKAANYTMKSERWGYSTPVRWAVRIHNNGEFIHGAPWSAGSQGSANVSHGCVNLTNERAKKYYDSAVYGDPVIIEGSSASLSKASSDISDWVYEWDEWKQLSALKK